MFYKSPLDQLYHWEQTTPDKIFLHQPIKEEWLTWTWKKAGEEVRTLAAAIKKRNLPPRSNIALFSKNCAQWIITDLAIMMAGHVSVPVYPNLTTNSILQILEHCEAQLLFVGKLDNWMLHKESLSEFIPCISLSLFPNKGCIPYPEFIKDTEPLQQNVIRGEDELATIIYTSGTTGMPKGVMHSFGNLSFVGKNAVAYLGINHTDSFFSYLPLSHSAERVIIEIGSLFSGGEIWFADSVETFQQNLKAARPTVFFAVHRIWQKMQQGMLAQITQKKLDLLLQLPIIAPLLQKKIKKSLGLDRAKNIICGASPIAPALLNWFSQLGIHIQEAYGTTEDCCYSHITTNRGIRQGFVGQPFPHCTVRLGAQNEVQLHQKALMLGYYKEPQLTAEAFTADGFYKTGDEGAIDEKGYLKITGRVKDLFKTSKGKYIAPAPIEMKLLACNDLECACVVGSGFRQPIALVTLSASGKTKGKEVVRVSLQDTLQKVNDTLNPHEQLEKLLIIDENWTVENELLTPTLKIKRQVIEKKYALCIEEAQHQKENLLWQKATAIA